MIRPLNELDGQSQKNTGRARAARHHANMHLYAGAPISGSHACVCEAGGGGGSASLKYAYLKVCGRPRQEGPLTATQPFDKLLSKPNFVKWVAATGPPSLAFLIGHHMSMVLRTE